jgi:hypothetical protein
MNPELSWHIAQIEEIQRLARKNPEAAIQEMLRQYEHLHAVVECYDAVVNEDLDGATRVFFSNRVCDRYRAMQDRQHPIEQEGDGHG